MGPIVADAVRLEAITCRIGGTTILTDVSLSLAAGEFVALVGPNGAGKTTLLRCAAGLAGYGGDVVIGGSRLSDLTLGERAKTIGYLPQGHVFHWPMAVWDIVALGRLPQARGADLSAADRDAVRQAMAEAGVTKLADRPVTTLSGGERARVALARVLATKAPVLLADEPTSSLDPRYQLAVGDLLKRQARAGGTVLAVLHDLGLAARFADRIAVLHDGRLTALGPPREVLTPDTLRSAFGVEAEIIEVRGVPVAVPVAASRPDLVESNRQTDAAN